MWQGRAPRLENLVAATSKPTGDNLLSRPSRVLVGLVKSGPRTTLLSGVLVLTRPFPLPLTYALYSAIPYARHDPQDQEGDGGSNRT